MRKKTIKWSLAQSLEIRWWKNYLIGKDPEAYLIKKKAYWHKVLLLIQRWQPAEGMAVLDCGCGPAGIFIALPVNLSVDAEDPLLDAYIQLPHFKREWYPNVHFFSVPLEDFVPSRLYDTIFCMNAINHVSDIHLCYDKLAGWLKPGGKLIITIDAHNHTFFRQLFRFTGFDALHPHQYNLAEYGQMLTERKLLLEQTILIKKEFFFNHYLQVAVKPIA
ncbi:bifunctional 2-polyprenyl-6-hydroxyphenol methylase/3-demethylubiquinol 3-O-methyltransferase UbiG [Asinibacterium sp. OR53]|uniref:class I SAM-dependent methyltransferase n=1 Tax=Asinibacterium sp. OR53 TaxID=925409 RepID=UPI0004BAF5A8|nr:class I SAM-dependent methyltransferase [Asinibacterium sp. OR53]